MPERSSWLRLKSSMKELSSLRIEYFTHECGSRYTPANKDNCSAERFEGGWFFNGIKHRFGRFVDVEKCFLKIQLNRCEYLRCERSWYLIWSYRPVVKGRWVGWNPYLSQSITIIRGKATIGPHFVRLTTHGCCEFPNFSQSFEVSFGTLIPPAHSRTLALKKTVPCDFFQIDPVATLCESLMVMLDPV